MKKIAAVFSLAVGLLCLFSENAQAQRRPVNVYSQMGQNKQEIYEQFNLVDTTIDGNSINDTNDSQNIGLFRGAIEQYRSRKLNSVLGIACSKSLVDNFLPENPDEWTDTFKNSTCGKAIINNIKKPEYYFDNSGFLITLKPNEVDDLRDSLPDSLKTQFPTVDLESEYIGDGDLEARFISGNTLDNTTDTIVYSLLIKGQTIPSFTLQYKLDLSTDFGFNIDEDFVVNAVNNLEFILDKDLLSKVVSDPENPAIVPDPKNPTIVSPRSTLLIQNFFEKDIKSVPESPLTPNVFATVVLGVILFIKKRKMSANQSL
ncbi:hypothetical protein NIES2107_05800 [Nostoc carneum NIES-2107]|nr:hypothetical protein NIES2107_05800 [Nostoc carneum NIES-2107]